MSLTLYFLRHGETVYSKTGAYCGEVDAELTPDGVRMAKVFADAYLSVAWTAVYVCPMKRTIATAQPLWPRFVAGVPPDYFSAQGQFWGNPVYNWEALRQTGYRWCIERLRALLTHVDVVRLDHFRGFAAAWHVPSEAKTARSGEWVPGPGADFFIAVQRELGTLPFIAEDLGLITPDVCQLRDRFQLPGTRVLQFAFDGNAGNPYLPHNYVANTVVYTGTHDNPTTRGWFETLPENQRWNQWNCLQRPGGKSDEVSWELIRLGVVFSGCPRDRATSGFSESGGGGADGPTRQHERQLASALH